jgi:RNA polymerase sigma factor (sigma-70 family)
MTDQEIIAQLKDRKEGVLVVCYDKFYYKVVRMIRDRYNFQNALARDIFQEVMIALWKNTGKPEFVLTCKLSTYLIAIAMRLSLKHLETTKKTVSITTEQYLEDFEKVINSSERDERIQRCLKCLSPQCLEILTLHYFEELSSDEIAQRLNFKNTDTVKTSKYKCMQRLRELVKSRYKKEDFEVEVDFI